MIGKEIEVWVCPRGHYFGSTGLEGTDLSTRWNTDLKNERTYTRDMCQLCAIIDGEREPTTQRVRFKAVITKEVNPDPSSEPMSQEAYFQYMEQKRKEGGTV